MTWGGGRNDYYAERARLDARLSLLIGSADQSTSLAHHGITPCRAADQSSTFRYTHDNIILLVCQAFQSEKFLQSERITDETFDLCIIAIRNLTVNRRQCGT